MNKKMIDIPNSTWWTTGTTGEPYMSTPELPESSGSRGSRYTYVPVYNRAISSKMIVYFLIVKAKTKKQPTFLGRGFP
jgi:hypothetical protein